MTVSFIVNLFGQQFFLTELLPGGRGSIEYAYLSGVAEKMGYNRPYTFYTLLTYLLNLLVGHLLTAAKISAILLFTMYLVSLYLLMAFYSSSRWISLLVLLTSFLPIVPDTLLKGDYMALTTTFCATILPLGLMMLIQEKHARAGTVFALLGASLLPFSDPALISISTIVLAVTLVILYIIKKQLIVYSLLLGSAFAGTALLSHTLNSSSIDGLWRPNPLEQLTSNVVLIFVLVVSAAVGAFNLYQKGFRRELVLSLSWISTSIVSSVFQKGGITLSVPLILALSLLPIILWRDTVKVVKTAEEGSESYYNVEIDLDLALRSAPAI
ncbi:MAG: hypothetical protein QXU44_11975, partial [Candidatus Caldarchaeum sp.]